MWVPPINEPAEGYCLPVQVDYLAASSLGSKVILEPPELLDSPYRPMSFFPCLDGQKAVVCIADFNSVDGAEPPVESEHDDMVCKRRGWRTYRKRLPVESDLGTEVDKFPIGS